MALKKMIPIVDTTSVFTGFDIIEEGDSRGETDATYENLTTGDIYKKYPTEASYIAKSVSFRCIDGYGTSYLGLRSIEFYLNGLLIATDTGGTWTYAGMNIANYNEDYAFDTSITKIGTYYQTSWWYNDATEQCIVVIFPESLEFDSIVINNMHSEGGNTTYGVKNLEIQYSATEVFSYLFANAVPDDTVSLFTGVLSEHIPSDLADDQVIPLAVPGTGWQLEVPAVINVTSYTDQTELLAAVGASKGITVTVDSEPGNIYLRNDANNKWIARTGNVYADSASIPDEADIDLPVGSVYVDSATGDETIITP